MITNNKGTVNSSLLEPNRGKPMSHKIKHQQVIMDANSVKGYVRGTVKRIQSHDMGKSYVGVCNGHKVVKIGHVNRMLTKKGETAGQWAYVA